MNILTHANWIRSARLLVVILISSVFVTACGRKGPPKPPEAFAPKMVESFNVQADVNGLTISWEAPLKAETRSSAPSYKLTHYIVARDVYDRDERADFEEISQVDVESSSSEQGSTQDKYSVRDEEVEPGNSYQYQVFGVNERGLEGIPAGVIRVTFVGESSIIERVANF